MVNCLTNISLQIQAMDVVDYQEKLTSSQEDDRLDRYLDKVY